MTALHDDRLGRLTEALGADGLDGIVVVGNAWQADYLRFATDLAVVEGDAAAVVLADGASFAWFESGIEADRARAAHPRAEVMACGDLVAAVTSHLARLGPGRRIAAAPTALLPHGLASLGLADGTALIDGLMLVKSRLELDALRRASAMADRGYRAFTEAVAVGRPQYEIVAEVEAFFRAEGCPENFMIMASGGREVRGMTPATDRRLAPGDLVTTELTPCVEGYYAQLCRTLVIGPPSEVQSRAFEVYHEAAEAGEAVLRGGVRACDIARAENDVFRRHGLGAHTTSDYTRVRGPGQGLFVDSKPHILEDVDVVLPAGAVVVVHPNTYHPEAGYIVFGDTSIITEGGFERLGTTARQLIVVD
jgi:Xaa-Pro aminopeptidase